MTRSLVICLLLFVATAALFSPARRHEFINYDDAHYLNDPHVRAGLTAEGIRWAFTTFEFANFHPLTWIALMIETELFGPDDSAGHHLVSVLLHATNVVLVFAFLLLLTRRRAVSAIVAALFAVHPLRVQSVAWASELKGLLSAAFFFAALIAYVRYIRATSARRAWLPYALALLAFGLSLLSKPAAVTLPAVLMLIDAYADRISRATLRNVILEKVPFATMAAAFCVMTFVAQREGGAMSRGNYPRSLRLENAIWSYGRYLALTVWPRGLSVFYPYEGALPGTRIPIPAVAINAAVIVAISLLAWRLRRRAPGILIGWLWFVITLVPMIGLVQVGTQSMADRYTYLPHVGLLLSLVLGLSTFVSARRSLFVAGGIALVALAIRTSDELTYWQNDFTLFTHALEVTDHNHTARDCLALAYMNRGDYPKAIEEYRASIAIAPDVAPPYYDIGLCYEALGRIDEARRWYEQALAHDERHVEAHINLANVLLSEGAAEGAIRHYRRAIELRPDAFLAHYNLGLALEHQKHFTEATDQYAVAVDLQPDNAEARYSYGMALESSGRMDRAKEQFRAARDIAQKKHEDRLIEELNRRLSQSPATTRAASGDVVR